METSIAYVSLWEVGDPQRAPVDLEDLQGFLFGQLHPCRLCVWEKLRPSRRRLDTAWLWLFVP